ncbi:PF05656 domain protein [Leptospira vanthielii serovar Holland str. Waz Holland = ATCC 700522]|uniref:PF05656 domain protein n=1 Tax=Leptospira vanthielii serovar Holland str. Waz Holland = ATCC 700522 TaxID=1218591 RepID=N1VVB4_9LEPT|nr:PF05656 domain protein [Leptospira vanthielii serovar Holland str. Waz Holland = ATCC 700522]
MLLPSLSVGARRLHDTGKSGWWQLIGITGIGVLVLIFFWAQKGKS